MFNWQNAVLLLISYVVIPRLTFLPKGLHTLLIVFGPFLLPRLIGLFNTSRAVSRSVPIRPAPKQVQRALNLLFVSAVVCLALSLPRFAPENIFLSTQSRYQIETNVLFTRLRMLRSLTPDDEQLQTKFTANASNKLLYFAFGPDSLLNCVWCNNDHWNYFLYSLPKLAAPHLAHLAVLGFATSSLIGPEGSRFRTHATIAGLTLAVTEIWYLGTYDPAVNKRAKILQEIDFAHWRIRLLRYLCFAVVDAALGATLWLTSTNRWLAKPEPIAQRLESTARTAEETLHKLRALGLLENSISRDQGLRAVREEYWTTEGQVMSEVVADAEVTELINQTIAKMDFSQLEGKVGEVADGIISAIDGLKASQNLAANGTTQAAS